VTAAAREGAHDLRSVSARLQASGRLAHSRSSRRPASQLLCVQLAQSNPIQSADPQLRGSRMILLPRISPGPRNKDGYETKYAAAEGKLTRKAPNASSTSGTSGTSGAARQKPRPRGISATGCLYAARRAGPRAPWHLRLRGIPDMRGGDGATARRIERGLEASLARISANTRLEADLEEVVGVAEGPQHRKLRGTIGGEWGSCSDA
jgi:hypothetical protein